MKTVSGQQNANAAGVAEVDLTPPPGYNWFIDHIAISSTSSIFSNCQVFLNQQFICGSNIGNADSADGSPIPVRYGDNVRFVWANCSVGAACKATVLVREAGIGSGLLAGANI